MKSLPPDSSSSERPGRESSDHFSSQAVVYAAFRPRYPAELFAFLAGVVRRRELAWDCATGNGQAAIPLAQYFSQVIATDSSATQIRQAERHEGVEYRVARADESGLPSRYVDLVTVAQALHWFDLPAFYAEVNRVLLPGGLLAVWSYGSAAVDTPALSDAIAHFEYDVLGSYWPPGRELVGEALRDLSFPFDELESPAFTLQATWTIEQLIGYVRSWSATQRYIDEHGRDPTPQLEDALRMHWGNPASHRRHVVHWPFVLRLGRVRS